MTEFASDQRSVERKRDKAKRDQVARDTVIRTLMSHSDGRRYIWNELSEANIFSSIIDTGPGGYSRMCFSEGKRSVGLRLLADAQRLAPEGFIQMLREANARVAKPQEDTTNGGSDPYTPTDSDADGS